MLHGRSANGQRQDSMNFHTLNAQQRFLNSICCSGYDLILLFDKNAANKTIFQYKAISKEKLCHVQFQRFLTDKNRQGMGIYIRPTRIRPHGYIFLDDLSQAAIKKMKSGGYSFSAIIETSPENFQGWLDSGMPLSEEERYWIQKDLCQRYRTDPGSVSGEHFGRLPGFLNTKMAYQRVAGGFPWVLMRGASAKTCQLLLDNIASIRKFLSTEVYPEESWQAPSKKEVELYRFSEAALRAKGMSDSSQIDYAICRIMYDQGVEPARIAGVLKVAMLEDLRNKKHKISDYIPRTLRNALFDKVPNAPICQVPSVPT